MMALLRWDIVLSGEARRHVVLAVDHDSATITLSRRLDHAIIGWVVRCSRGLRCRWAALLGRAP